MEEGRDKIQQEINKQEKTISKYFERITNTQSHVLIEGYEKEIEKTEECIKILRKNLERPRGRYGNVGTLLEKSLKDVYDAKNLWKSSKLDDQIKLLKSIFPEGIPINKKRGVGTPKLSLIYQAFELGKSSKNQMVDRPGLEPGT